MKIQNRLVLVGLIAILFINNSPISPTQAVTDPTAPVFSSVSFDRSLANVGDIVTVTIVADDPESGVAYCYSYIYGPSSEYLTSVYMSYNSTTGVCTGTFEVDQYWSSLAYVYYIELANNENNYSYFYDGTAYASPVVNFGNTTPDYTGPVLQSVAFNTPAAYAGDLVTVIVGASDPESSISYCYANIYDEVNNYIAGVYLYYNASTGLCTGDFEVDQFWLSSAHIGYIELNNNAGNYSQFDDGTAYISPVVNFLNTTPDYSGALLDSVWLESTYLYVGEDLTVSAYVNDPESGIDYCYGNIYGTSGYVTSFYMNYDPVTGSCSGSTTVDEFWPSSVYLYYLEIRNNAHNSTYFYHGTDFTSSNATIDYTDIFAPEIYSEFDYNYEFQGDNWINVDSNEAGYGYVYLDGMLIASLTFASPDSFWFNTTNFVDGEHNLTIWVSDYSGNFAEYYYTINIRNAETYFETFWYTYDNNNNGMEDSVNLDIRIDYSFNYWTYVEVVFTIERWDPVNGNYYYYNEFSEGRDLINDGVDWFYFYFDTFEEGDYRFTVDHYVDFEYQANYYTEFYLYLDSQYSSEFQLDLFADEDDRDGNGQPDHIQFVFMVNFQNLQPTDVEIKGQVMYNGQEFPVHSDSFYLEGWGDHESAFEFQAEEDAEYYFVFEIFVNGDYRETKDFNWDGHRFDPETNSNPTSNDGGDDESSAAPELPVPAGSFYLFIFAIFSSTVVLRRKQN
ncbi:MAG: hypothetical protein GPJ54_08990 [Candidatus Heimdallarchaeota archaeon]|nr:hypothetical protein [Candidatus Heimdallarchaeota archaeon]